MSKKILYIACLSCIITSIITPSIAGQVGALREITYEDEKSPHAFIEPDRNPTSFMDFNKEESKDKDIHFSADELENNEDTQIITATGSVNISRSNLSLVADRVTYNQNDDTIIATGNVMITEASGDVVYSDNVKLQDKMSKGDMDNIKVILKDKSRMWATSAQKYSDDNKIMRNVIYTPCDNCKNEKPLWQLKAGKVAHDALNKNVNYQNARIEVKGVPVFYTPFLSHPDPTVKRRSGFLPPTFRSNSYLGAGFQPKYFWNISDQEDLTLAPIFTMDKGVVADATYRKYFYRGNLNAHGSIMKDDDTDKNRGHLFLDGRYEVSDFWEAKLDINYASSGSYLHDLTLDKRDDTWLVSSAKLLGYDFRDYAAIESYYYKLISYDAKSRKIDKPYIVPLMTYENISDPMAFGSYFKTTLNYASVLKEDNESTQRATMINAWILPFTSSLGDKYKLQASMKSDLYYVDNYDYDNGRNLDGALARIFPQLGLEWKLPFVKATESSRQIFEPTIVAIAAPNGGQRNRIIPNEDSLYQEIDDTNVLSLDRYAGYDRNDTGSRVSYGFNWSAYGEKTGRTSAFIAQTYNFTQDPDNYPTTYATDDNFSDYVGRIYAAPNEYISFDYRFRADKDDFKLKYSELAGNFGPKILNAYIGYIKLHDDNKYYEFNEGYTEREEIYAGIRSQLTRDWSIEVYDLVDMSKNGGTLEYGGKLTYEDECLKLITNLRKNNSNDPEFKGDFEISVTFILKTLGGVGSE